MTWSPAHQAIESASLSELKLLLDSGVDIQDPDENGTTLLHHSIDIEGDLVMQECGILHVDMTALLLAHGADPRALDRRGQTPLDWAMRLRHWLAEDLLTAWMNR